MTYTTAVICTSSIAIAAIIGLVRYRKINQVYYPILYLFIIALVNEILNYIFARTIRNNSVNNNIYVLMESLLITWQFAKWGIFNRYRVVLLLLMLILPILWIIEIFIISDVTSVTHYFRIFYSFIIVLMSIHTINGLIVRETRNILKNPAFLICIGFVLYFTLKVLVQTFWLYGTSVSQQFRLNVVYTHIYVNLFANLIYALAVLWMPRKLRFSMPS